MSNEIAVTNSLSEEGLVVEQFATEEEEIRPELDIPPKDRKLVTHPYDFITRSLVDQIDDGSLVLADKFQRRVVWDDVKASRLIESLLLNVPIPVCYFAEIENGAYSVIDGQQRLTAIYRFLKNEYPLRGLRVRPELNKKRFSQLEQPDKRLVNSRSIRCIVILKESHPDIRFDVFERLNTSSVRLNAQELRNSIYRGNLNDLLRELSEYPDFLWARNVTGIDKRMQDCELILRFFAFSFSSEKYKGYLAPFLDDYLRKGVAFERNVINEHKLLFQNTIKKVRIVFDNKAFRRYVPENDWEKLVNRAIYDVIMLSFASISLGSIEKKKAEIKIAFQEICQDKEFDKVITSGTQTIKAVQDRLDRWYAALNRIGVSLLKLKIGFDHKEK